MRSIIFTILLFLLNFNQNINSQITSIDAVKYKNPCSLAEELDAALYLEKENKNYFFKRGIYLRLSNNKIDKGYPTKIKNGWKDLPDYWNSGINAAIRCEPQKKTIFFKGREYFSIQNGHPISSFPKKLPGAFKKLPRYFHSNIDAGMHLPDNNRTYLFKGNQYVRLKYNKVESDYPKKLPGEFKNLPNFYCSDLDAVLHCQGATYFFKKGQYVKYKH